MHFKRVTILGVGLIGASFALAMKKHGLCSEIIGCGRKEENLKRAKERQIIDSFETDPAKACTGADLVVLATPVGSFPGLVKKIRGSLKKGALVTDVGSVKGKLVHDIDALMPEGVSFVGGASYCRERPFRNRNRDCGPLHAVHNVSLPLQRKQIKTPLKLLPASGPLLVQQ